MKISEIMEAIFYKYKILSVVIVAAFMMMSCGGDDDEGDPEPEIPEPTASFSFEVNEEDPLLVSFTNTSEDGDSFEWDFGDGTGTSTIRNPTYTYTEGGTYTVTLTATNEGGSDETSQEITVEELEEEDPNLIAGGNMEDPTAWTITKANYDDITTTEFVDGQLVFSNDENSETHVTVWQEIEVEAGDYVFSADVSGSAEGALNSWLQIHFSDIVPEEGVDYNFGQFTGINTWDGCLNEEFSGNLAVLGCKLVAGEPAPLNGKDGAITFEEAGTIYVALKVGSLEGYLGEGGIAVDNITLLKTE